MKRVIEIPEQWEGCTNRHLRKCISEGIPLTEVLDDIKAEIGTVMTTNMGIYGEEDFDRGCKMCLAVIDHQGEQGMTDNGTLTEKEKEFLTQGMKVVIDINKDYFDAIKSTDPITFSATMLIIRDGKPLMEVFENIKTEIEDKYKSIPDTFRHYYHYETGYTDALEWVLGVIDKHISAEGG